jgi:hypothetical protein
MRPARAAPLLLLPLLAAALAGCAAYNDLVRFVERAQGVPEFQEVERLREEVPFTTSDSPAPPPAFGKVSTFNFTVPRGVTDLTVDVSVAFSQGTLPSLPGGLPKGRVHVEVQAPDRAYGNVTFTETSVQTFEAEGPTPGTWGVVVQTFGQGRVLLTATTTELVPP